MRNITGASISFGLRQPILDGGTLLTTPLLTSFSPTLASLGVPSSDELFSLKKSIFDWATGSVTYCDSPVGIVRLNEPAMPVIRLHNSTTLAAGTIFKINIPYVVDDYSVTVPVVVDPCLPFTNYTFVTGNGVWTGANLPPWTNVTTSSPFIGATFGLPTGAGNFKWKSRLFRVASTPFGYPTPGTQYRLTYNFSQPTGLTISFWMGSMVNNFAPYNYSEVAPNAVGWNQIMPSQNSGLNTPPSLTATASQYGRETFILPLGATSGSVLFNWGSRSDGYWAVRTGSGVGTYPNGTGTMSGSWQFQIERICSEPTTDSNNITPSRF
jgi:hypothetical protein